jgi:hypothetical protein
MARDIVVLSGYLVRCPLAGYAWQVLHYLLGLRAIGLEPYFYEDTAYCSDCFDPASGCLTDDPGTGIELAARFFGRHGLASRWFFEDGMVQCSRRYCVTSVIPKYASLP